MSFAIPVRGQSKLTLAWDPSASRDVAGYNLYYGGSSQNYSNLLAVGPSTNATVSGVIPGTTYYFAVAAVDMVGLESALSTEIRYTVPLTNPVTPQTPPTVSSLPDQTLSINAATPQLAFLVGDAQTPAANLVVTATSSNPTLVPNGNITLGGAGSNRWVVVTPANNQVGTATIALTVCDTSLCTTRSFNATWSALPTVALTSPAPGSTYTPSSSIAVSATVTPNGHTVTSVRFYSGSTLLGNVPTAPYTVNWTPTSAGAYSLTAQAVYDSGSTVSSAPVSVTVQSPNTPSSTLPAPWQTADIGTVGVVGGATVSNAVYTINGAGNLSGSLDNFRFVYQGLSGDGEIRAQITSADNTGNGDCVGVMIRESLTSGSRYALMGIAPGTGFRWQRRNSTSGGTSSSKGGSGTPPACWVRLVRTGNTLDGYKSTDGTTWTLANSAKVTMASNIYVGFEVASGKASTVCASAFANVVVVP